MESTRTFTLVLNSKKHAIPSINILEHIKKMPIDISEALIFQNYQYIAKAKVSDTVSQSFIEYLINNKKPDIRFDNYHEYLELSREFNLLVDLIEEKEKEWGKDLQYFNGLYQNSSQNKEFFETKISQNLDYYLEKFSENFMKQPISILCNIFFNKECKLTKHNLAYELIKMHYKNTDDSSIFVLLPALDGMKLNDDNLEESIRYKAARHGFIPKFEYSYLLSKIEKLEQNNEQINELQSNAKQQNSKIDDIKTTFSNMIEKEIAIIKNDYSNEIKKLKAIIEKQNDAITIIKSDCENQIKSYKSNFEMSIKSIKSECLKDIKSAQNDCESKIKLNESNYKKEIQAIQSGYEKEINSIKEQLKNEIQNLKQTINIQTNEINSIKSSQTQENTSMMQAFENKMNEIENKNKNEMNLLKAQQKSDLDLFKIETDKIKSFLLSKILECSNKSIILEPSLTENGIFYTLKTNSTDLYDPPFIVSQSSNDIYNLIDPNTNDSFSTSSNGHFFINFELENTTAINGIKIYSSNTDFPKSFNIEIDGEVVKSIKEANELNGKFKEMTINFPTKNGKAVRFVQTGPNWNEGTNFLYIKRFELLSPEPKYSKGIFTTLINKSAHHDPHRCGVHISSMRFDFNTFHLIDTNYNICTLHEDNEWFQIELTRGFAIITGFRLKRDHTKKMRRYKIIGSDSNKNSIESWTELIQINEEMIDEHKTIDIYSFPHPSPPIRFIRIVQTGPRWDNKKALIFHHFEIFGTYI